MATSDLHPAVQSAVALWGGQQPAGTLVIHAPMVPPVSAGNVVTALSSTE